MYVKEPHTITLSILFFFFFLHVQWPSSYIFRLVNGQVRHRCQLTASTRRHSTYMEFGEGVEMHDSQMHFSFLYSSSLSLPLARLVFVYFILVRPNFMPAKRAEVCIVYVLQKPYWWSQQPQHIAFIALFLSVQLKLNHKSSHLFLSVCVCVRPYVLQSIGGCRSTV